MFLTLGKHIDYNCYLTFSYSFVFIAYYQKNDFEVALVGAFRREKDKDIALKALAAENQAALQLVRASQIYIIII